MSAISQVATKKKAGNPAARKKLVNSITSHISANKQATAEKRKSIKGSGVFPAKIRAIGNSKGIIINNQLMEAAGIHAGVDLIMYANEGKIILMEAPKQAVNTNLATWDKHFKAAIKKGTAPEPDMFDGMENNFDKNEW